MFETITRKITTTTTAAASLRVMSACPARNSSISLFINHDAQRKVRESQAKPNGWRRATTATPTATLSSHFIFLLTLVTLCPLLGCWPQASAQSSELRPNLPTVIVRGFLNYRTTVDGTVLLFTPDAGGSAASQTSGATPVSSTFAFLPSETVRAIQTVEPTSVLGHPMDSSTLLDGSSLAAPPKAQSVGERNEWRPVQATPPLKTAQTAFRPSIMVQPSLVAERPAPIVSFSPALLISAESSVGSGADQRQGARLVSSGGDLGAPDSPQRSTPSVQADDVLNADQQQPPVVFGKPVGAISIEPVQATTQAPARASRPKRPVLGFNGQTSRSRPTPGAARVQQSNEGTGSHATNANTINGIRRPGLSTTTSTNTPVGQSSEASTSATMLAFQNRLTNASVRLRNKLRRPPFGGNSTSGAAASASTTSTTTTSVSNDTGGLNQPTSVVAQPAASSGLLQPAESGEDLVIGDLLAAPAAQGVSPDQSSGTSVLLQLRLGESFNPSDTGPTVGSDEVIGILPVTPSSSSRAAAPVAQSEPEANQTTVVASGEPNNGEPPMLDKPISRSGEQRPRDQDLPSGSLTGDLQQGQLGNMPLSFDGFFQSDQPTGGVSTESSEHQPSHQQPKDQQQQLKNMKNNNEKLNGWLDQHHNKFIPRPASTHQAHEPGHMSHQLAANLNSLAPSFASNIPSSSPAVKPTPASATSQQETMKPAVGLLPDETGEETATNNSNKSANSNGTAEGQPENESLQMQTITKTYSTIMTTSKTRLVPLQVKSGTAIYTITENYVITKMLTAYQTMPVGEFILAEPLSTRAPFEMFNEVVSSSEAKKNQASTREQPISAPSSFSAPQPPGLDQQEQPISLDNSQRGPNDWLHDFSNMNSANSQPPDQQQQQQQSAQQTQLAALLEQQAQEANLAGFALGEPLDQLASSLDPAALLADGTINVPDLNNPLVLAAAIQNPQLAAVILAAQQLRLKQRNKLAANPANQNNQIQPALQQLQPSYSTSLSTTVRPSTYTVRDTMYTTRLVSFRDGRTVRTRTVSEPGSVIEQVLTTMATEVTPVTFTIRPTGLLSMPSTMDTSTGGGGGGGGAQQASNQATINNALIATQLASLLARRQQQVQPGMSSPAFLAAAASGSMSAQAPINQLTALQQLVGQQQQQQQQQQRQQAMARQFQPNLQQLLQSMQQQPAAAAAQSGGHANANSNAGSAGKPLAGASNSSTANNNNQDPKRPTTQEGAAQATPSLPIAPAQPQLPITTTLTNLQVRTYTVHNAFKTIYRTITSTQLITSTIFPAARSTQLPSMG